MIDFSNKDNIKIAVMVGLAVVLLIVIAKRFSGSGTDEQPVSAVAGHQQIVMPQSQTVKRQYSKAAVNKAAVPKSVKYNNSEAPPFLTRDLFNSRNWDVRPKREADQKDPGLKLNATITDDGDPLAIIGDEVLGIGDSVKGFKVTAIRNHEAVLSGDGKHYTLRMTEE